MNNYRNNFSLDGTSAMPRRQAPQRPIPRDAFHGSGTRAMHVAPRQAVPPQLQQSSTIRGYGEAQHPSEARLVSAPSGAHVEATTARRSIAPLGFRSWQEFRIFTAGAMLAVGLLTLGYYLGISRPLGEASGGVKTSIPVQVVAPDGTTVEVDSGISAKDVDTRPPVPVVGTVPKKLLIPSIYVNAPIRSLGTTSTGALAVPNYLWQVGWFDQSSRPGMPGTVVLDGHYNGPDYAVFKDLHKLNQGDVIKLENGDGEIFTYAVEGKESFDKDSVAMNKLIASDGSERLNIITCIGDWQQSGETFSERLVIYAKRV